MQVKIDSTSKFFMPLLSSIMMGLLVSIWATFIRPQIVMASDLQVVIESVERIETKVNQLATMQVDQKIYYLQDQIRVLEVTRIERDLIPTEAQRLLQYKDDLGKLNR